MSAADFPEGGWGRIIVELSLNGVAYTASAGSICQECAEHYGSVSVENLTKYGVASEISQVCLSFWYHHFPNRCGDWYDIPAVRVDG